MQTHTENPGEFLPNDSSEKNLLLVEDDQSLGESLSARLQNENYKVIWVQTVSDALQQLSACKFDLCILDIGLPDGSGFNVAREIKLASSDPKNKVTPVIFLTAMNSAEYRLEGFEIGCDDYIPKPFHLKELLLRVKKVIERNDSIDSAECDLVLDSKSFLVTLPDGKVAHMLPNDFALLKLLVDSSPAVVERQKAFSQVFGTKDPATRTVDNAIVRIRTLLGKYADGRLKTVRGVGYQFIKNNSK